ncbi:hypothetical protein ACFQZC_06835 [Streptacidiphilus monticola]
MTGSAGAPPSVLSGEGICAGTDALASATGAATAGPGWAAAGASRVPTTAGRTTDSPKVAVWSRYSGPASVWPWAGDATEVPCGGVPGFGIWTLPLLGPRSASERTGT